MGFIENKLDCLYCSVRSWEMNTENLTAQLQAVGMATVIFEVWCGAVGWIKRRDNCTSRFQINIFSLFLYTVDVCSWWLDDTRWIDVTIKLIGETTKPTKMIYVKFDQVAISLRTLPSRKAFHDKMKWLTKNRTKLSLNGLEGGKSISKLFSTPSNVCNFSPNFS